MKYISSLLLFFLPFSSFSQHVETINPTTIKGIDLSPEFVKKFNSKDAVADCEKIWEKMNTAAESGKELVLSKEEKEALNYCDETREDAWDILGGGCSWYCGGGVKRVTASSILKAQGRNNYDPGNANDLSYKTAWVEGAFGFGIGEYLKYYFVPESPRVNKILVVNGYVKSRSAYENNSRVKKLKVYVDNNPYVILNLEDTIAIQEFEIEPVGHGDRENLEKLKELPEWNLKFEIMEVYRGLKYDDVAITEIFFDGLDVHCFAKGTEIQMADGSVKNIEDLQVNDEVFTVDIENDRLLPVRIEKLEKVWHDNLVTYLFESGTRVTATRDHPFRVDNKGWSSLNPIGSSQYKGFNTAGKIEIGDLFYTTSGLDRLLAIELVDEAQATYTISKLSSGSNFIANGFVVGVEELYESRVHSECRFGAYSAK